MKGLVPIVLIAGAGVAAYFLFIKNDGDMTLLHPDQAPLHPDDEMFAGPFFPDGFYPTDDPAENFLANLPAIVEGAMEFGGGALNWIGEQWAALTGAGGAAAAAAGVGGAGVGGAGAAGAATAAGATAATGGVAATGAVAPALTALQTAALAAVPLFIGLHPAVPRVTGDIGRSLEEMLTGIPKASRCPESNVVTHQVHHVERMTPRGRASMERRLATLDRRGQRFLGRQTAAQRGAAVEREARAFLEQHHGIGRTEEQQLGRNLEAARFAGDTTAIRDATQRLREYRRG